MSIFGAEFDQIWPKAGQAIKLSTFGKNLLKKCQNVEKPDGSKIDIEEFMKTSAKFPIEFGINTCRVMSQPKERHPIIKQQIASAYPVIHERVLGLYLDFLEHKCKYGNKIELEIYAQLTLTEFIQRLLKKRCVSFIGKNDKYLLITNENGISGFMEIGTAAEKAPLLLHNVLNYDEIKLSALLSVSSHSEFINDGNRQNVGVVEHNISKIEQNGVVIGIIGARLTRRDVMEFQDIIISKTQNTSDNGYGERADSTVENRVSDYRRIWKQFYEENDFLYNKVVKDQKRFGDSRNKNDIFDNLIMKKRYTISFDTLLLDSEARAAAAGKQAFIHVVGIGLGVWRTSDSQEKIFLETFAQRIKALLPRLKHISVMHFSWFSLSEWGDLKNGGIFKNPTHPDGGIRTFLSKRNPADKLKTPEESNMLLIVSYAWDGNAMPGNEFWMKMLKSTGDSSTACSTLITELHNPHINGLMVNGSNLHIATEQYGVIHIADYSKKIIQDCNRCELKLYPNLTLTSFVQRLLEKRCVSFFNECDEYLLLSGQIGQGGFFKIGTLAEKSPLTLDNVLSYDEIKLSAFLSVSSPSEFINDGNRHNAGQIEVDKSKIVTEGVVVGIIGGRFERPGVMESQDMLITKIQNTAANGYGDKNEEATPSDNREKDYRRIWKQFYGEQDFLYDELANVECARFSKLADNHDIFDNLVMKKRYAISFDMLLLESEAKAAAAGKQCYIHVVGIGLGVWKAVKHQTTIFLETFTERLKFLLPQLTHVGCVHFSWFHVSECGELKNDGFFASTEHPSGGIRTYLNNRNPAEKLPAEYENMLLVVSYAWDGNALPGNEFWMKMLTSTGDSSTACSTLISELHNPHINIDMVNGNNLHVATLQHGVKHISDYSRVVMAENV